jgi:hypothetical protein
MIANGEGFCSEEIQTGSRAYPAVCVMVAGESRSGVKVTAPLCLWG